MAEPTPGRGEAPLERIRDIEELERFARPLQGVEASGSKPKGPSLCYQCCNSMIYRRASSFDDVIRCTALTGSPIMPHDIAQCSSHWAQNRLSLSDMAELAYRVDGRKEHSEGYY